MPNVITGHDAIDHAETHGLLLSKYEDPTEESRHGLTADEARVVAQEDPSLIYCDLRGIECDHDCGQVFMPAESLSGTTCPDCEAE